MTLRKLIASASIAFLGAATTAALANAQAQSGDLKFDGSIALPVDIKDLHPDVAAVELHCHMVTPAGLNRGVTWTDSPIPSGVVVDGSYKGTLTMHFTAHRASFTRGELWEWQCFLHLRNRTPPVQTKAAASGSSPSSGAWNQMATNDTFWTGNFTLR